MSLRVICFLLAYLLIIPSAASNRDVLTSLPPQLGYTILQEQHHDSSSFTQGLYLDQGLMYESSGLYGKSFVHIYNNNTNTQIAKQRLPRNIFAETDQSRR